MWVNLAFVVALTVHQQVSKSSIQVIALVSKFISGCHSHHQGIQYEVIKSVSIPSVSQPFSKAYMESSRHLSQVLSLNQFHLIKHRRHVHNHSLSTIQWTISNILSECSNSSVRNFCIIWSSGLPTCKGAQTCCKVNTLHFEVFIGNNCKTVKSVLDNQFSNIDYKIESNETPQSRDSQRYCKKWVSAVTKDSQMCRHKLAVKSVTLCFMSVRNKLSPVKEH